jgi:hypothetical protein
MGLPFDANQVREYAVEFGAGGQRLGCEFRLHDGSVRFVNDSQITPEIEQFISSLGSPTATSRQCNEDQTMALAEVVLMDFDGTKTICPAKLPLPQMISNGDADEGILIMRSYAKTDQRDEHGRTVYVERNCLFHLFCRLHRQSERELRLDDGVTGSYLSKKVVEGWPTIRELSGNPLQEH